MFSDVDHQMMQRALELARLGLFTTQPNPRVGCVIAQGDRIVGEGWHRKSGEAHAEPLALRAAGEDARGSTVYVTLEPHCHRSRTPPCTDALIKAGVARVICATLDFNPQVHGQGVEQLRAAGIQVDIGLMEREARELNAGFEKRMQSGIPRVTVKIGASLDGRTALGNGESRWITGIAARADVQRLRAANGAVLTGIGTVIADDPLLTVRDPAIDTLGRQPLRGVVDSQLRMPPSARMFKESGQTVIFTCTHRQDLISALEEQGANVKQVSAAPDGRVDLNEVLRLLGELQCNDILVEAGAVLAGRIVEQGLADELIVYMAPSLLGSQSRPMMQLPPLERLADRLQWRFHSSEMLGDDLKLVLRAPDLS
ncbi:MAG: bifunctional diaminohydroxyphosphoribosylaminopyrimidine deaminase/5-amino-6-(5-phosphoribosylamino)uracil reductase RibD [Povalibacter sp.]